MGSAQAILGLRRPPSAQGAFPAPNKRLSGDIAVSSLVFRRFRLERAMSNHKEYTRQELYDLVWSTPMVKLAKEFGLSDVGRSASNTAFPLRPSDIGQN